jgi:CRISPR/Cas system-associated protein Csm6
MLELPDPVFRLAEAKAEELGIPVQQLVAEIVEEKLRNGSVPADKPWMECFGELSHLHEETERINRIIEEEFEQIEPEE